VSRTFKDRKIITRISNIESVEIEVFKEADANIVSVAQKVRDKVFGSKEQLAFIKNLKEGKGERGHQKKVDKKKEDKTDPEKAKKARKNQRRAASRKAMMAKQMTNFINHNLPADIHLDLLSDQSVFIKNSVDEVKSTAVMGGLLAVLVLFIFLRKMSATLIVGLSIPVSIVATFAPMKIFGVSLNIMSLGGLALGIGMLVDNSIVVLESIARCREEGDDLAQATVRGVGEVGGAVFASTLTTVAVFFPIVFVEGVAGQIFGNMALTVVFSLLASLAVALFLIPMLSSRQSSKFIEGVRTDHFGKQSILFFENQERVDDLLTEDSVRGFQRIRQAANELLWTIWFILRKVGQAFLTLVIASLKHAALLLAVLTSPIWGLTRVARLHSFRISEWIIKTAEAPGVLKLRFTLEIWPTFLVASYARNLILEMGQTKDGLAQAGTSFGQRMMAIFKGPFYLIKFIMQFCLTLLFNVVHIILLETAVLLKGLYLVARILLTAPSRFLVNAFNWAYERVEESYPRILRRALSQRGTVLGSVTVLLLLTFFVVAPRLGSELIPEVHQGEFNLEVTLPVGTPVEKTDQKVAEIQAFIMRQPGVKKVASASGTDITANSNSEEGEHTAKITVTLNRPGDMKTVTTSAATDGTTRKPQGSFAAITKDLAPTPASASDADKTGKKQADFTTKDVPAEVVDEETLIRTIRQKMQSLSGIRWKVSRPVLFSFKTPIEVEIHGYNLQKLQQYSRQLEERMAEIPGVIDIKSNMQRGNPEVQIVYNRALLAQFGLNIRNVASIVRNKIRGDIATEFKEQDRKIDVLVRLRERDRESIEDLSRLVVNPGADKAIPLEAVADIKVREGPSEIRRVDQERTATITANLSGRSLSSVSEEIFVALQEMNLPDDFTFRLAGQNEEMETSLNSLKLALALAIFLVYIVMASQFESMIHPFIIIFTIPLALIGVIIYLFAFKIPLSIVVFLGMIMLAGIVVNNAIVLVDYINTLRERGVEKMEAIVQAGSVRLRPIVMTTATTVLGLLPMALGLGDGAEIRTPMAITVIIGLLSSTILTLIIIPTVYSLVDRRN